jgi:aspartyl-tRNA(Asn)/glutamyl-tRNA(Gln) amidotransferase subunit A
VKSLNEIALALSSNETNSQALVEAALENIEQGDHQGAKVFTQVYREQAVEQAQVIDQLRGSGHPLPGFAGIPVSVKDLFDVAGEVTTGGSVVLKDREAARQDAFVVKQLRQAGFIVIGKTNMTEFAYSGLGINPHYGTPLNPFERDKARIPGGSSSGAAVAITDNMAAAGIGTDTGGSCRIPAALCGIVGFKPSAFRVSQQGMLSLSTSMDSIGPLAPTVACCAAMDTVLTGERDDVLEPFSLKGLRLAIPASLLMDDLDEHVSRSFNRVISRLSELGVLISDEPFSVLSDLPSINAKGGLVAAEAYAWHQSLMNRHASQYDPKVLSRILRGGEQSAADYIDVLNARQKVIGEVNCVAQKYDAIIHPTVPVVAPTIDSLADDDSYNRMNLLMLRNPSVANFLDYCAISLPCHEQEQAPVGVSLMGMRGVDRRLLSIALAVESSLFGNYLR